MEHCSRGLKLNENGFFFIFCWPCIIMYHNKVTNLIHFHFHNTIKCSWKWKCIKLVTLLWEWLSYWSIAQWILQHYEVTQQATSSLKMMYIHRNVKEWHFRLIKSCSKSALIGLLHTYSCSFTTEVRESENIRILSQLLSDTGNMLGISLHFTVPGQTTLQQGLNISTCRVPSWHRSLHVGRPSQRYWKWVPATPYWHHHWQINSIIGLTMLLPWELCTRRQEIPIIALQ
jgi:hypothetical protein